jgi:hypothetical protein
MRAGREPEVRHMGRQLFAGNVVCSSNALSTNIYVASASSKLAFHNKSLSAALLSALHD